MLRVVLDSAGALAFSPASQHGPRCGLSPSRTAALPVARRRRLYECVKLSRQSQGRPVGSFRYQSPRLRLLHSRPPTHSIFIIPCASCPQSVCLSVRRYHCLWPIPWVAKVNRDLGWPWPEVNLHTLLQVVWVRYWKALSWVCSEFVANSVDEYCMCIILRRLLKNIVKAQFVGIFHRYRITELLGRPCTVVTGGLIKC